MQIALYQFRQSMNFRICTDYAELFASAAYEGVMLETHSLASTRASNSGCANRDNKQKALFIDKEKLTGRRQVMSSCMLGISFLTDKLYKVTLCRSLVFVSIICELTCI